MPFRSRSRRSFTKKRSHVRRTRTRKFTRRSHRKGMRSTTSKDKTIVTDRKFVNFKYVTVTSGAIQNNGTLFNLIPNVSAYGMIPDASDSTASPDHQMFVFAPSYETGTSAQFDVNTAQSLPGNSLALINVNTGWNAFSDTFAQTCPTGVHEWSNFYENYICHGSSVEVTMVDCLVPGQLFVMPVTDDGNSEVDDVDYTFRLI